MNAIWVAIQNRFYQPVLGEAVGAWLAPFLTAAILAGIYDAQALGSPGVRLSEAEASASETRTPQSEISASETRTPITRHASRVRPSIIAAPNIESAFFVRPHEAIDWFKAKEVLSAEQFKALEAAAKARAFSVAGLTDQYALSLVKDSLQDAIGEGKTITEWHSDIENRLASAGLGIDDMSLSHWELVYRQNVATALDAGRYVQMQRSADARPYWQYITVGDDRVRPEHAALDGVIKRADDPFWSVHYPPNGFNCRCIVVSLDEEEMAAAGLAETPDPAIINRYDRITGRLNGRLPPPDRGFDFDPAQAFFLNRGPAGMPTNADGQAALEQLT